MVKMNKPGLKLLHIYDNEGRFFMCGFLNPSLIALHCRQGLYLTVVLMHYPSQFHCLTIYIVTWILSSPEPKALLNISCCSGLLIYHYLAFHMITWFFIPLPGCLYQHLAFWILLPGCLYDHYSSVGEDGRHIRGQEMNQTVETWQKIYTLYTKQVIHQWSPWRNLFSLALKWWHHTLTYWQSTPCGMCFGILTFSEDLGGNSVEEMWS